MYLRAKRQRQVRPRTLTSQSFIPCLCDRLCYIRVYGAVCIGSQRLPWSLQFLVLSLSLGLRVWGWVGNCQEADWAVGNMVIRAACARNATAC